MDHRVKARSNGKRTARGELHIYTGFYLVGRGGHVENNDGRDGKIDRPCVEYISRVIVFDILDVIQVRGFPPTRVIRK